MGVYIMWFCPHRRVLFLFLLVFCKQTCKCLNVRINISLSRKRSQLVNVVSKQTFLIMFSTVGGIFFQFCCKMKTNFYDGCVLKQFISCKSVRVSGGSSWSGIAWTITLIRVSFHLDIVLRRRCEVFACDIIV